MVYTLAHPYFSQTGQPSTDHVAIFKALLVGYFYGRALEC